MSIEEIPLPKSAPSQRAALRGWSLAVADEFYRPGPLGAHEFAAKEWGRAVADLLWPLDECVAYYRDELGFDDEDSRRECAAWEGHGR